MKWVTTTVVSCVLVCLLSAAAMSQVSISAGALPLQPDGTPMPDYYCEHCKLTCGHTLQEGSSVWDIDFDYDEPWYRTLGHVAGGLPGMILADVLDPDPTTAQEALGNGWDVTEWVRGVDFEYNNRQCSCRHACPYIENPAEARCFTEYIASGFLDLTLTRTINSQTMANTNSFSASGSAGGDGPSGGVEAGSESTSTTNLGVTWVVTNVVPTERLPHSCCKEAEPEESHTSIGGWPNIDGVEVTVVAIGANWGEVADLWIDNNTGEEISVTIPEGLLLDSGDPAVQDLYVMDVPCTTPYEGDEYLGVPITVDPYSREVVPGMYGGCPDFELAPPDEGAADTYTPMEPDDKAEDLLAVVDLAKDFDVGSLKLDVFAEDKAREMLAQGGFWICDSEIDDVVGNEVTEDALAARYWDAFEVSAGPKLAAMAPDKRAQAEALVKDDIKDIVSAASIVSKRRT